jgi:hypothetical protein
VHLLLAGQRNIPANGRRSDRFPGRSGMRPLATVRAYLYQPSGETRARRQGSPCGHVPRLPRLQPAAQRQEGDLRVPDMRVVGNLPGTWAVARAAASGEGLGAVRTGGSELVELIGHTGDSCAQSPQIARKIRTSQELRALT